MAFAKLLSARLLLGVFGGIAVGCVPYQKYKDTVAELERAKQANADLIKKYNQLHMRAGKGELGDPATLADLRAENLRLQNELARSGSSPAFRQEDIPSAARSEEGGLALGAALLFAQWRADLKSSAYSVLDEVVSLLQENYSGERIIIEGHTDIQPLKSTRRLWTYNMNLGYNRALAVFKYFEKNGISEGRMILHSYSFNRPLNRDTMYTSEGKRENRRVVIRRAGESVAATDYRGSPTEVGTNRR